MVEFICTIVGKNIGENITKFYYNNLKNIDETSIKSAFNAFASRGIFPTVEQVMKECGFDSSMSAEEIQEIKRQLEKEASMEKGDSLEDMCGECAFHFKFIGSKREEADRFFDAKIQGLKEKDWCIKTIEVSECKIPKLAGGTVRYYPGFTALVFAARSEPETLPLKTPQKAPPAFETREREAILALVAKRALGASNEPK